MGRFFAPDFGELEITPFYSDNEIYCQEVRFSVPYDRWPEFERSPEFQRIKELAAELKAQYKKFQYPEPERELADEQICCTAEPTSQAALAK
mgnify:CR=1 FL=1